MSDVNDRGWCLCLSGGGFRATLFHLGAIIRLNELGVLSRVSTITSVSGGSILNGLLAVRWARLKKGLDGRYTNLNEIIAEPMRQFCRTDLRTRLLIGTRLNPAHWAQIIRDHFSVSGNFLAKAYEEFYGANLSDIHGPSEETPRFVFCATNLRSGACWHFHSGPAARMGDFYTGYCDAKSVRVSEAVAASSAFPPGFSALRLPIKGQSFSREDPWMEQRPASEKRHVESRLEDVLLTDGGVYDNLAVEPIWKTYRTIFASDAGSPFESVEDSSQSIASRLMRAAEISMEQVGAVRKRWLVEELTAGRRAGAIWTIHSRLDSFPLKDKQGYGSKASRAIQRVRTDLNAFSEAEIRSLTNHGYSIADAAVRSYSSKLCLTTSAPFQWPDERWLDEEAVAAALIHSNKRDIAGDLYCYVFGRDS